VAIRVAITASASGIPPAGDQRLEPEVAARPAVDVIDKLRQVLNQLEQGLKDNAAVVESVAL
jgi:hypothetical protein